MYKPANECVYFVEKDVQSVISTFLDTNLVLDSSHEEDKYFKSLQVKIFPRMSNFFSNNLQFCTKSNTSRYHDF